MKPSDNAPASPDPASLLFFHRLIVRFRDCDPLGHVNNAVYLTYLEQARLLLWRAQFGEVVRSHSEAHDPSRPSFILARTEIDYRAQARYGDQLEVRVKFGECGRSSFTYIYEIVDVSDGRLIAAAKTVMVRFDYRDQKSVPIDDALRAQLATPPPGGD